MHSVCVEAHSMKHHYRSRLHASATVVPLVASLVFLVSCGDSSGSSAVTTEDVATSEAPDADAIVNTWTRAIVDPAALPIGDDFVSTDGAAVGGLWACRVGNPNAGGAQADGPWLDIAAGTWDSTTKVAVEGSVVWEAAEYTETVADGSRVLTTNDLPVEDPTGTFPIASDDPSYQYDRNPGTITAESISVTLPQFGTVAESPTCMDEGEVGMFRNGVVAFNSLDGRGDDAVAHESQDLCNGHPAMTTYHYHSVPVCLRDKATESSTVVGFAYDGFPIVVERDPAGELPTNADLDECHGRTSPILLDGEVIETYHYSATLEFPYFIGCYKGTPAA
jgi:YHYH protein